MGLFFEILKGDLKERFKRPSTYIYFLLFASLSLIFALATAGVFPGVTIGGASHRTLTNSPFLIYIIVSATSFFAVFIFAPIFGQNAFKDYLFQLNDISHSQPFSRNIHFLARFSSAFLVSFFIFSSVAVGFFIGTQLPLIDPSYLGPFSFEAYLRPYIFSVIPNLLVLGGIFFFMGAFFKRMLYVYLSGIFMFLFFSLSNNGVFSELENKMLRDMLDLSGLFAVISATDYWTAVQKNSQMIPLEGHLLYNRLLWVGVGLFFFGLSRYFYERVPSKSKREKASGEVQGKRVVALQQISFVFGKVSRLKEFWSLTHHELTQSLRNPIVIVNVLLACGYMLTLSPQIGKFYGTTTLPTTYNVIEMLGSPFSLFILIILTFWSGEMLHQSRSHRFDELVDSSPVSWFTLHLSKLLALNILIWVLLGALIVCGVIIQTFKGYYHFELALYLKYLFLILYPWFFVVSGIAFFAHCFINNKFMAHGFMILYYIYFTYGNTFGLEKSLFVINEGPSIKYSDMNSFGPNLYGHTVFSIMWAFLALFLILWGANFFQRGKEGAFKKRLAHVRENFKGLPRMMALLSLAFFSILWSFTYYNTSVVNSFVYKNENIQNFVRYEKEYKKEWLYAPRPEFIEADVAFHLYPKKRWAEAHGDFVITNTFKSPIERVLMHFPKNYDNNNHKITEAQMEIEGGYKVVKDDRDLKMQIIELNQPLRPNEKRALSFTYKIRNKGFKNQESNYSIVRNGSFVSSSHIFPSFGYDIRAEVSDPKERRRYGLGEKQRSLDVNLPISSKYTYIASDARRIQFKATVSTSSDQIIIAPGQLQKEWIKDGRYFAQYVISAPILKFFTFISARYKVLQDKWQDVNIEIFYHDNHDRNLPQMMASVKESLSYFSENFSPYQYKQFRIFEVPRYMGGAQAFANTIPFSEGIGFIAHLQGEDDIDYPFYVTSHELAHQWFGHQIAGGPVPGFTMLVESLAQYGALMVMEDHYGKDHIHKFLRYELDRYLRGRARGETQESPLALSEGQPYISYQKASMVFYRLKEAIGEERLNGVISKFIQNHKLDLKKEMLPTASQFVDNLIALAPEKKQLIHELFYELVLYENRVLHAKKTKAENGKYTVDMKVSLKKIKATPKGKEEYVAFLEDIPVGVRNKEGQLIYYKTHKLKDGEQDIQIQVEEEPIKVGVDPLNTFINKSFKRNEIKVF